MHTESHDIIKIRGRNKKALGISSNIDLSQNLPLNNIFFAGGERKYDIPTFCHFQLREETPMYLEVFFTFESSFLHFKSKNFELFSALFSLFLAPFVCSTLFRFKKKKEKCGRKRS